METAQKQGAQKFQQLKVMHDQKMKLLQSDLGIQVFQETQYNQKI